MGTMPTKTTSQLIAEIASDLGTGKMHVKDLLVSVEENIVSTLKKGMVFKLGNAFRVKIVPRKARMFRNPQTGESFKSPATKRLKFTAGKSLKALIPKKVKK